MGNIILKKWIRYIYKRNKICVFFIKDISIKIFKSVYFCIKDITYIKNDMLR